MWEIPWGWKLGLMACRRNRSSIKSLIWFLNPQHAWQLWCGSNLEMDQWWCLKLEHGKKTLNSCNKKMQTNTILHIGHGFCDSNDLDLFKVMLYLMHLYAFISYAYICIKLPSWEIFGTFSNYPQSQIIVYLWRIHQMVHSQGTSRYWRFGSHANPPSQ